MPMVLGSLAWGHYLLGELEDSRHHALKGIEIQKNMGLGALRSWLLYILAMVHLDLGEIESAYSSAKEALDFAQKNKEILMEGISWTILGKILGKKEHSQSDKAEEYIIRGINIIEELKVKTHVSRGYLYLGEHYADSGQTEKALENLKTAEKMFQEMGMDFWLTRTQEVLGSV